MAFFNVTPQAKYEALYPVLTQEADQTARQRETSASWYEGVGTGVVNGLKSGYYRDLFATAQATGEADLQQKALQAIQDNKPDPTTIGMVGQVLHGFGEQAALATYSFSGGDVTPNLMAMRTGVSYSASQQAIHEKEGMDPATAQSVARTEGAGVGLGLALPAAVPGKLLVRAASGAGINAVTGMGQRAIISDTLRKAGYDDMAKQYEVLDGTALATDIALGAFFGGLLGPRGSKIDVPPSTVDAALVARQQMHMEVDSAPGIPTNTRSRNAHVAAMDASMDALARGERVDVEPIIRGSEFADKPIPEGVDLEAVIRAELDRVGARDVIDDLRRLETEAQARGIAVEADALPEVQKATTHDSVVIDTAARAEASSRPTAQESKPRIVDTRGKGELFHGTSQRLLDDHPNDDYAMSGDNRNIYGQGFYTTDAADIAAGYMKKGKGKEPSLYSLKQVGDVKIFDMDQPLSPRHLKMVKDALGDLFFEENGENGKKLRTLRDFYDEARAESKNEGYSRDDVQEMFDSVRYNLEKEGFSGFKHRGGDKTGSVPHEVKIFWTPERHLESRLDDIARFYESTDAKLQPPEVEKPSMTIPDETGKPVLATDAVASVDAEVKQAGELSKVMDVAVECAMRFGQ